MPNSKSHKAFTIFVTNAAMERMINEWERCDIERRPLTLKKFHCYEFIVLKTKIQEKKNAHGFFFIINSKK